MVFFPFSSSARMNENSRRPGAQTERRASWGRRGVASRQNLTGRIEFVTLELQ